jgi:hypothetical protein
MRIFVETSGCITLELEGTGENDDNAGFGARLLEGEDHEGRPGEGDESADLRDSIDPGSL